MASGQEQEQDRTEPASPFKLREARKRGQVNKSLEINSLLLLSAALLVTYALGEKFFAKQMALSRRILDGAYGLHYDPKTAMDLFAYVYETLMAIFWPLIGALMLIGILANLFQTGPVFSFFSIKPDMNRINPVQGFKRIFSKKLLFECIKTILKTIIFGTVIYFAAVAALPSILALIDIDPSAYPSILLQQGRGLAYKLLMVLLIIALADLMFSRWMFSRQMRMSRRELKEEVKRREGDPQIRARRRQLQREAVKRAGAVKRVPDADVLITNPTRLAIALQYRRGSTASPQVIAKGAGGLAAKMKTMALEHKVPIVENRLLAKELFSKVDIDESIPEYLFQTVAKILAWVYLQREQALGGIY